MSKIKLTLIIISLLLSILALYLCHNRSNETDNKIRDIEKQYQRIDSSIKQQNHFLTELGEKQLAGREQILILIEQINEIENKIKSLQTIIYTPGSNKTSQPKKQNSGCKSQEWR